MTPRQELVATLATTPVLKASFVGVTGPQGPPGPEGPPGPAGPAGPPGSQTPWTTDVDAAGHALTNAGKVGIGTTTPAWPLDVVGHAIITAQQETWALGLKYRDSDLAMWLGNDASGSFQISNSSAVPWLTVTQTGSVGIGTTTPVWPLEVCGRSAPFTLGLQYAIGHVHTYLGCDINGALQVSDDGGVPRATITQAGRVGIGTTGPAHPLDVAGDINCTGNYLKNGAPVAMVTQEQYDALVARIAALEAKS